MKTFDIFNIQNTQEFEQKALTIFRYQAENNQVYKQYLYFRNINPAMINSLEQIPFLPIQFFKTQKLVTGNKPEEIIFTSSGTTGGNTSRHYVTDLSVYRESYRRGFEYFYGKIEDYVVLALLPSYLEREGSSLILMVEDMIQISKQPESGFYLYDFAALYQQLKQLQQKGKKVLLIGVSFALLDFVEQYQLHFPELIVMETGGMKGRRKEMIRAELHQEIVKGFGVQHIHSEYGMTELLSQAYSQGEGIFSCPPWMKLCIRDTEDPLSYLPQGKTGGVNVIDLANYNSISFIATDDLGKQITDNQYELLGRFDYSDVRGCNLLL